jgi:hypothetical protein
VGHDKGGVEARGKAVRGQALVPIPSGPRLDAINDASLTRLDARLETTRDAVGRTIGERFSEEVPLFRPLPAPFVADATTIGTVSQRALSLSDAISFNRISAAPLCLGCGACGRRHPHPRLRAARPSRCAGAGPFARR